MIKTLQAGRAVAAFAVAAYHLSIIMGEPRYGGEEVFRQFTRQGNLGVDFFFVLSGFIILFAHFKDIDNPGAVGKYLYRRFVRIFPVYWLYTLVFVGVLAVTGGTVAKVPSTVSDWITSLTLIRFTDGTPPLTVAWTLFHEVAFYATFSILIINKRLGIGVFILISAISILLYHFPAEEERTPFNVYTSAYNLYFLLGMGAYMLYRRGGSGVAEFILGLVISLTTVAEIFIPQQLLPLTLALGMALLLAAVTKFEAAGKIDVPKFITLAGDASFTIYLTHTNFQGTLLKIMKVTGLQNNIGNELTYIIVLVGTIVLGCVAYLIIEKPILGFFGKYRRPATSQHKPDRVKPFGVS